MIRPSHPSTTLQLCRPTYVMVLRVILMCGVYCFSVFCAWNSSKIIYIYIYIYIVDWFIYTTVFLGWIAWSVYLKKHLGPPQLKTSRLCFFHAFGICSAPLSIPSTCSACSCPGPGPASYFSISHPQTYDLSSSFGIYIYIYMCVLI